MSKQLVPAALSNRVNNDSKVVESKNCPQASMWIATRKWLISFSRPIQTHFVSQQGYECFNWVDWKFWLIKTDQLRRFNSSTYAADLFQDLETRFGLGTFFSCTESQSSRESPPLCLRHLSFKPFCRLTADILAVSRAGPKAALPFLFRFGRWASTN